MKPFTLHIAEGIRGNPKNQIYSKEVLITSCESLRDAVCFDHTEGYFKDNHRSTQNFISADVLMMDCDNTHSEDSSEWLTPEKLALRLPRVEFYVVHSRNYMKDKYKEDKDGKRVISCTARPRFHVYFALCEVITDAKEIRRLKEAILRIIPEFDAGAKDAARFFFGVSSPHCEENRGEICIDN